MNCFHYSLIAVILFILKYTLPAGESGGLFVVVTCPYVTQTSISIPSARPSSAQYKFYTNVYVMAIIILAVLS